MEEKGQPEKEETTKGGTMEKKDTMVEEWCTRCIGCQCAKDQSFTWRQIE